MQMKLREKIDELTLLELFWSEPKIADREDVTKLQMMQVGSSVLAWM
ncbi:MAG: hypothetical protein GDA56_01235 [Hormoscilla sp. GM7CHS1pb]|nr:hypothetical protein [Hormoscilla sp. GM7CHS1pb]